METLIETQSVEVVKTGTLEKTGEEYSLVLLSAQHIPQIIALQDIAFADLTEQEKTFLLRKDSEFFKKHFTEGNAVLGIVHDGKLISQSVIVNPTAENPKTGIPDMELTKILDKVTVLQCVIVDPAYRGNRLMSVMVDEWLQLSHEKGRTQVLCEVALENSYSWSVFLKNGLHIERISVDPVDNAEVYTLHGELPALSKVFNKSAKKVISCPQKDIAQQKELLAKGYRAAKFDPANGNLEFRPAPKKAPCPKNG